MYEKQAVVLSLRLRNDDDLEFVRRGRVQLVSSLRRGTDRLVYVDRSLHDVAIDVVAAVTS